MMSLFTADMFRTDDEDAGVSVEDLSRALLVWAAMNGAGDLTLTVQDAAKAFNTTSADVMAAILECSWMTVTRNDVIELDGE
jgi:hypothetical protein